MQKSKLEGDFSSLRRNKFLNNKNKENKKVNTVKVKRTLVLGKGAIDTIKGNTDTKSIKKTQTIMYFFYNYR